MWWLNTSRRWTAPLPINVYVIEHERGLVLFDTGQDRRSVTEARLFPERRSRACLRASGEVRRSQPDETLGSGLASLGYDIADVHTAILSHLHQDHIGGLPELAHARIVVSAGEFAELDRPFAAMRGLLRAHIDLPGLRWQFVTPVSHTGPTRSRPSRRLTTCSRTAVCCCVPTPGHTPGSLSLILRQPGPCHSCSSSATSPTTWSGSATERVPGVGSASAARKSTRAINELVRRHPGALVLAAHDPRGLRACLPRLRGAKAGVVRRPN